jgi:hypothetical protein
MANRVPPSLISGAANRAMRMKEWQEMSMAMEKPSDEQFNSQGLDMGFGFLVEIGHGQLGTQLVECLGTTVSNRVFVGNANHQRFSILENRARRIGARLCG